MVKTHYLASVPQNIFKNHLVKFFLVNLFPFNKMCVLVAFKIFLLLKFPHAIWIVDIIY